MRLILRTVLIGVAMCSATPAFSALEEHKIACDATQISALDTAVANAKSAILKAADAVRSGEVADQNRFIKWFGGATPAEIEAVATRYDTMLLFTSISTYWCPLINNLDFAWDVGDAAAVHPNEPNSVFFTPAYFTMKLTGSDTQTGTLVHEIAHQAGAGLKPEVYGTTKAKALAKSDPTKARNNADNYQYFVEDLLWGVPRLKRACPLILRGSGPPRLCR
jgi:peptidyl-Lys metalloendopeptidase